jgi:hypothetical protein
MQRAGSWLRVQVYDADTLCHDLLGTVDIKLDAETYCETLDDLAALERGRPFHVSDAKTGKHKGTVMLAFAACILHVKVHK